MNIFTRSLTDELASLVKKLDKKIEDNSDKKMAGFVVLLTDDTKKGEADLKEFARKHKINIPLTLYLNSNGPENYNVSKDAEHTVLYWISRKVKANRAFGPGKLDKKSIDETLAASSSILK